jgi:hypothetical protein
VLTVFSLMECFEQACRYISNKKTRIIFFPTGGFCPPFREKNHCILPTLKPSSFLVQSEDGRGERRHSI